MKDILIAVPVETKFYPETLPQCENLECDDCLVERFIVAGKCHHEEILKRYFTRSTGCKIRNYHLHNGNTTKYLPESHLDCNNLSCAKCIMDEFRFQNIGGDGMMVCTLKNMLNKYMR